MMINKESYLNKISKFHQFSQIFQYVINKVETTETNLPYLVCFESFSKNLEDFTTSLLLEIDNSFHDTFYLKVCSNQLLLRNCIESNIILNIISNNPDLAKKFYDTIKSDDLYINKFYMHARNADYEEEEFTFQKRYGWLPKLNKKRAFNIVDLLAYASFDNEENIIYYETLIRNLDYYSHPAFYLYLQSIDQNKNNNVELLDSFFSENGIILTEIYNIYESFKEIFKDVLSNHIFIILSNLIDSCQLEEISTKNPEQITEYLKVINLLLPIKSAEFLPLENIFSIYKGIQPIIVGIASIGFMIKRKNASSYKSQNLLYLINDLLPRLEDYLLSYYLKNSNMFFIQTRYILESVSTINILVEENESRSLVYQIHQNIKSYESHFSNNKFSKTTELSINKLFSDEDLQNRKLHDIEHIKLYYKENYNLEYDDKIILRLNGWALNLSRLNNTEILNTPKLITHSINPIAQKIRFISGDIISTDDFALGLYEESSAHAHVSSYSYLNRKNSFNYDEKMLVTMIIIEKTFEKILNVYQYRETQHEIAPSNKLINEYLELIRKIIYEIGLKSFYSIGG